MVSPTKKPQQLQDKDLLVEVKTNTFYGFRTIAKKVKKYGQVKNLALHEQMKTPIYFVNYEKEENKVQALTKLTKEEEWRKLLQ